MTSKLVTITISDPKCQTESVLLCGSFFTKCKVRYGSPCKLVCLHHISFVRGGKNVCISNSTSYSEAPVLQNRKYKKCSSLSCLRLMLSVDFKFGSIWAIISIASPKFIPSQFSTGTCSLHTFLLICVSQCQFKQVEPHWRWNFSKVGSKCICPTSKQLHGLPLKQAGDQGKAFLV